MAAIDARGDDVVVRVEDNERSLMLTVFTDLSELLNEDGDEETDRPDTEDWEARLGPVDRPRPVDPAVLRLLPAGDHDHDDRSAESRRLTEFDPKQAKAHNVRIVLLGLSKGNDITLTHDEVLAWMKGLNDLRLVLAVRLGIDTEEAQEEK